MAKRYATESIIQAEELEREEDEMNTDVDMDQNKPNFPAISAVDAMVISCQYCVKKVEAFVVPYISIVEF
jgi:hypothetical protein